MTPNRQCGRQGEAAMMASEPLPIRLKDGELQKLAKVHLYDINCAVLAWAEARDALDRERPTKRKRRPTLAGIAKQAAKAGLTIVRVDFDLDGRVIGVVTVKPGASDSIEDDATPEQRSRWH
jgi:hypothetical protein